MHWHAQITSLTLRAYAKPGGYDDKRKFIAVVQAELLGDKVAYLHGALRVDGVELGIQDWRGLGRHLRETYGIEMIMAHRGVRLIEWPTSRAGRA